MDPKEQFNYLTSGAQDVINSHSLKEILYESKIKDKPLRVKFGTDPTARSLHLGHMVPIHLLKKFEDLGHKTYFLIGDFTARIGDPSGKLSKRIGLSREEVDDFGNYYLAQVGRILDFSKTTLVKNSSWFGDMNLYEFVVKIASKYTVAQMLARDDFSTRYKSQLPIQLSEFLYPLLQAYDSVALEADVEIGGNDQLFNFLLAREVQKQFGQKPQCVITLPTIKGLDGKEKMSKALGNTINVSDNPFEMYSKIMSINDNNMVEWFELLSSFGEDYIQNLRDKKIQPKEAKQRLAYEITSKYNSIDEAKQAEDRFNYQFGRKGGVPEDIDSMTVPCSKTLNLIDLVYSSGFVKSKSEARRLISQKSIRIDGTFETELGKEYDSDKSYVVSVGKKKHRKLILQKE